MYLQEWIVIVSLPLQITTLLSNQCLTLSDKDQEGGVQFVSFQQQSPQDKKTEPFGEQCVMSSAVTR